MTLTRRLLIGAALISATLLSSPSFAEDPENTLMIKLKDGTVKIELYPEIAPKNVERIKQLALDGAYDGVAFHRVIDGFMAQTGDVEFGNTRKGFDPARAGTGGSSMPDLPAEFTDKASFDRGVVGMARSRDPNSANSQFFIMFAPAPHLDGQYTIVGKVVEGMEFVDAIKKGVEAMNGTVDTPDVMESVYVLADN